MLIGKHVRLRILDSTDLSYMRHLRNSPDVTQWFQYRLFINDAQQAVFFESLSASKDQIFFVAETLVDLKPFGIYFVRNLDYLNQRCENGVFLDSERAATGIEAFEAAFLLLEYEFSCLNLHKICAEVLADNRRAIRFNESLGMIREGIRSQHVFCGGMFRDLLLYRIFRDDFLKRPTAVISSFLCPGNM